MMPDDLLILIASYFEATWYILYKYFDRFRQLHDHALCTRYIALFVQCHSEKTFLFGKLHSIYDQPIIDYPEGIRQWYWQDQLHRENGPALEVSPYADRMQRYQFTSVSMFIYLGGDQVWFRHGKMHRDDGPARIWPDGSYWWCQNGRRHRADDLPACYHAGLDSLYWYKKGKLHREYDLPAVVRHDGECLWYKRGNLHRGDDLPAMVDHSGTKFWYRHNKLHRDGGRPAIEFSDGRAEWYHHGNRVR